ncbi:DUF2306 domain-containing protein [Bacillus oleivorans]|nr:DUF2306 domain-containing protein [Bacillus oleivorans]
MVHILTGFICLATGLFAMFSKKKKGIHTLSGEIYHWSYVIVFVTSVVMSILHWEESQFLLYIALFSYGFALLGYLAVKHKWKNWLRIHIRGMLGSYIGIVTATLVVNVHQIPILNELPPLVFWFLPTIIGTPFIFYVLQKYGPKKGNISSKI